MRMRYPAVQNAELDVEGKTVVLYQALGEMRRCWLKWKPFARALRESRAGKELRVYLKHF